MSNVLKGNFEPKNPVAVENAKDEADAESVEAQFEREALKRLGGSIAFVSKKKVMWDAAPAGKTEKTEKKADDK